MSSSRAKFVAFAAFLGVALGGWYAWSVRSGGETRTRPGGKSQAGELSVVSAAEQAEHGERMRRLGRAADAELALRNALAIDPNSTAAHRSLAHLLTIEGRRFEASSSLFELTRKGQNTLEELIHLADLAVVIENREETDTYLATMPDDLTPTIAWGRMAIDRDDPKRAREILERVVREDPRQLEAQGWLGWTLADSGDEAQITAWRARLPRNSENHPQIWVAHGRLAEVAGKTDEAIRCFWEAIRRDPNHLYANYQLSQLLLADDRSELAEPFADRAKKLRQVARSLIVQLADPKNPETMRSTAELTESLGRLWESLAWYQAALKMKADLPWAIEGRDRLKKIAASEKPPRDPPANNPAYQVDLTEFPLPEGLVSSERFDGADRSARRLAGKGTISRKDRSTEPPESISPGMSDAARAIHFEDSAPAAGIDFKYINSADESTPGARLFETIGGGVGVLDFDADGWPDIYLTQGCAFPPDPKQTRDLDRLFRNLGDGRFAEISATAGIFENGYSQGVAAGDFDNDGFPDLYVANIGKNRLFRNLGDGTFLDVTDLAGAHQTNPFEETWTTSVAIVDLNQDGLPDLFDVTYAAGEDVHERICNREHNPGMCAPAVFEAPLDRCFLNLGDGRFERQDAGLDLPTGYGLGLVVADFAGKGRLDIFVANDGSPNFYLENQVSSPGEAPRFVDRGEYTGLAVDADGRPQACMGVACDDANGDGRLDLFVTNLYEESNALYIRQPNDQSLRYKDVSRGAGIREPSWNMLGFGTQFLDGDRDGRPDLVVANGHVDDFREKGVPYEMRPQFFRNRGRIRFEEAPAVSLGAYFERPCLGRGLALVDWNRDGREDFCVGHLDFPAALLTNRSDDQRRFLAIRARGITRDRDAIGATVTLKLAGGTRSRQFVAGSGFQASNEPRLLFGLGDAKAIEAIVIRWLEGSEQRFENPPLDSELLLIEGAAEWVRLR